MSPAPYLQHGRRHAPLGGSDPLPPAPYIAGTKGGLSVPSNSTGVSVDLVPASTSWGTDAGAGVASDYFDLRKPGATYEIALLRNALYVIDASMFIDGGTAPVAGSAAEISISTTAHSVQIGGAANDAFRHQITGTTAQYHAQPSFRALLNADTSYGAAPVYTSIAVAQNTGSTATNVTVDFLVTLLGLGNTGF